MSRRVDIPDWVIPCYQEDQESLLSLARRTGLGRPTLWRHLKRNGIPIRDSSEANRIRMARLSPEERKALATPANSAIRGRKVSFEELAKRAKTLEQTRVHASPNEVMLEQLLKKEGGSPTLQRAVGGYNIDLALGPLAVEVMGGGWHGYGRHRSRSNRRTRTLLKEGWVVVAVWCYGKGPAEDFRPTLKVARWLLRLQREVEGGDEARRIHSIRYDARFHRASTSDVSLLTEVPTARLRNI